MSRPLLKVEVGVALDLPLVETEIGHCWTYVLEFSHTMQNRSAKAGADVAALQERFFGPVPRK
jgi:hypothetical protein